MSNKHLPQDLAQMQSLPLEAKEIMSDQRIDAWFTHWNCEVYVSFSGGKDSTVLADLVARYCERYGYKLYLLFVNTGLEYPEIQKFVKTFADWLRDKYNIEVQLDIVRPKMRFDEVLTKYGYPVISKEVAQTISQARKSLETGKYTYRLKKLNDEVLGKDGKPSQYNIPQYKYLLDAPYLISHQCCDVMKKNPAKAYEKETGRKAIIATMASESRLRYQKWLQHGCNAFEKHRPTSQPLSFWTEQDILHYIKKYGVPYCSVYGDIVVKPPAGADKDQLNVIDFLGCYEEEDVLTTTGCDRTGCIFCMFGCHLEKEPNRFQRLKETHPRQYEYCINGGENITKGFCQNGAGDWVEFVFEDDDGNPLTPEEIDNFIEEYKDNPHFRFERKWQPSKEGLGIGKVLDFIGCKYD